MKYKFQNGDSVRITEGPFEGFTAVIDQVIRAFGIVRVLIDIHGKPTPVELDDRQIEPDWSDFGKSEQ